MALHNTLSYLQLLAQNNNKIWFDLQKPAYENARSAVAHLAKNLISALSLHMPEIHGLDPKDCLFRINRDVRFSKDKSPYKTNMSIYIAPGGKKSNKAGFYVHIEPMASFMAGGIWMPEAQTLYAIRQEIDYHFDDFLGILQDNKLKANQFSLDTSMQLVNPPKGFEKNNPAIQYIKLKSYVMQKPLSIEHMDDASFENLVIENLVSLIPFCRFLNTAIES